MLGCRRGCTLSKRRNLLLGVILVVSLRTLRTLASPSTSLTLSRIFFRGFHGQVHFLDTSFLESLVKLGTKSFDRRFCGVDRFTDSNAFGLRLVERSLGSLHILLQLLLLVQCFLHHRFCVSELSLGISDILEKFLLLFLRSCKFRLAILEALLVLGNGFLEVSISLVFLLLLQLGNVLHNRPLLFVEVVTTLADSLFVSPQVLQTCLLAKRTKMLVLGLLHFLNSIIDALVEAFYLLLSIIDLFLELCELLFRRCEQRGLLLKLLRGILEITLGVLVPITQVSKIIAELLNLGSVAKCSSSTATAILSAGDIQLGPFILELLLFFSKLNKFALVPASSTTAVFAGDTSSHGSSLTNNCTANGDSLEAGLRTLSGARTTVSKAQFSSRVKIVAHYSISDCVENSTLDSFVTSDDISCQTETAIFLRHSTNAFKVVLRRNLNTVEWNKGGRTDSLLAQVLDTIKASLLCVDNNSIHILTSSDSDGKIESTLGRTTEVDKTSLYSRKVTLETGNSLKKAFFVLVLTTVVLGIAKLNIDVLNLRVELFATHLGLLRRFLNRLEFSFGFSQILFRLVQALGELFLAFCKATNISSCFIATILDFLILLCQVCRLGSSV
mmetsp:Transcript_19191/g.34740  ORF Transcript_19191/g.34740 Transcript_19191/m.34740 type:complete len:614 (-) Transcript_19191:667-2508(-)